LLLCDESAMVLWHRTATHGK